MRRKGNYSEAENFIEHYLNERRVLFFPTNEGKKLIFNNIKISNFDLLIPGKIGLILDTKGKRILYPGAPRNTWENWVTLASAESLNLLNSMSDNQKAYFLFAYSCYASEISLPLPSLFKENMVPFKDKYYALFYISIEEYLKHSKPRSKTPPSISVSRKVFATLIRPFHELLQENVPANYNDKN